MCNNNCCMCCQCDNTHDEDTPQEITYTSVCDSDACKNRCKCCCCNNGICEDDASLMVLGLSEKMEECCDEVHKTLESIACQIEGLDDKIDDEIERSIQKDDEHDQKNEEQDGRLDTLEYNESLDFNRVVYVTRDESQDHKAYIEFYHNENYMGRISAEPFLKDGILDSVDLESDGHTLHFVWNTDAGKQDSHVDLDRLVQPLAQELQTEITNRTIGDNTINNNITNLKNSITGYNPELGYDGTAVTVGQIDGKQFKVHMATFPELVQTVENSTNNRIAVTTNKGNTSYVNIVNDTYETIQHAQNTYETIADANNHIKNASFNNNTRKMTFTKQDNTTFDVTVPDANDNNYVSNATVSDHTLTLTREGLSDLTVQLPDNNNYVTGASVSGHTLTINRNGLSDLTVSLPDDNDNNYVTGGSVANNVLTLTRQGLTDVTIQLPVDNNNYVTNASITGHTLTLERNGSLSDLTVTLPDDDHNYYVTGGSVSGNTLTLTRSGGLSDVTISLPSWITTYDNNYVTSATVSGTTLTLTRNGLTDLTCQLPAGADGNNYVTSATFANNTLTLGRNGGLSDVTCNIPIPAADNTNPITDVSQSGDTVTFTYKDNTSETITVGGNTNVTYGGNTVTLQAAITDIENRLNALEGLWEINPNDSTQLVAKSSRSAKAAGFYDSTVS